MQENPNWQVCLSTEIILVRCETSPFFYAENNKTTKQHLKNQGMPTKE
jgi:hypothetical protein